MGEEEKWCGRLKEHEHALPSRHPNSDPIPTTRPYSRLACGGEISLGARHEGHTSGALAQNGTSCSPSCVRSTHSTHAVPRITRGLHEAAALSPRPLSGKCQPRQTALASRPRGLRRHSHLYRPVPGRRATVVQPRRRSVTFPGPGIAV